MDMLIVHGFWTWSRWWWRRRQRPVPPPAAVHRLRHRPSDRAPASAGGNPSVLSGRRMPCLVPMAYRMRPRRKRTPPILTGA